MDDTPHHDPETIEMAERAFALAEKTIAPFLRGQGAEVQGGALTALIGMFLASYHPAVRQHALDIILHKAWEYCAIHEEAMGDPWKDEKPQ